MKKYLFLALTLLFLVSCRSKQQQEQQPILTVTIEPLRYFTEAIAGDKFKVESMVPEGNNPETYDPTPQQLVSLSKSRAYLRIGYIGFEQIWMDKLKSNTPGLTVFDTSEGIMLIKENCSHHNNGNNHGHYHAEGIEPHIWNSVKNARIIADNICKILSSLDTANTAYYRQKRDSLDNIFDKTEKQIQANLPDSCTFLIYHPALTYFAHEYGLTQISIEEGGKEPSPSHLQKLIKECQNRQVNTVFVQKEFDTRNAELIAKEIKAKIVPINPLNYNWPDEMIHISQALSKK